MTTEQPAGRPAEPDALEDLSYGELHDRAFKLAQKRRDIGFFIDLISHTKAAHAAATEGGSLGDLSGSMMDVVEGAREALAEAPDPELEPLLRARFATYLREHGD
jgi:hypothetical protein